MPHKLNPSCAVERFLTIEINRPIKLTVDNLKVGSYCCELKQRQNSLYS